LKIKHLSRQLYKWATETLFTLQMGTQIQKEELIGSILGTSAKVIKEVFSRDANKLPCVYLFILGTVKNLRESMNIDASCDDNSLVCKYGFTCDLGRRTSEHISTLGKIKGVDLKLKYYSYIDPQYISKAENDIKCCVDALNINLPYEKQEELIVVSKEHHKLIENQYELIGKKYMGHISEIISLNKDLRHEMEKQEMMYKYEMEKQELKYKLEFQNIEMKLMQQKCENELLNKDIELSHKQVTCKKIVVDAIDKKIDNDCDKNNKTNNVLEITNNNDSTDVCKEFANKHITNNDNGYILWADLKSKFLKWHHENKDEQLPSMQAVKLYFEKYIFKENEKTLKINKKHYRGWRRWLFC
jgi:hypothetical protein